MNHEAVQRLGGWLSRELGEPVHVESAEKLGGEAARETWKVTVTTARGERPRRHLRVVRGEAPSGRSIGRTRSEEFALLCAAHAAGVLVPRPLFLCNDAGVLGAPFFVTDFASRAEDGERRARGRGDGSGTCEQSPSPGGELAGPGQSAHGSPLQSPELAAQLGRELAKLHRITTPQPRLNFLERAPRDLPAARIDRFRRRLDAMGDPQPVLEWAMRQLECNAPQGTGTALCHGAPSAGSCLVDDGRLLAILDWKWSRWGDPCEDVGEFCAACRRFVSQHRDRGAAASRAGFLDGYREISRLAIDEDLVRYWEVMATLGRAVSALEQGHRFVAGGERSIELALTGRRVAEMEIDLLVETDRFAMEREHA